MKSLTNKSLTQYIVTTLVILLVSLPVFYFLTKFFYAEEIVDVIHAMQHGNKIPPLDLEQDIVIGIMLQFLLIFIVLSVSLLITLRLINKRIWQPFDDLLAKIRKFNLEQKTIPEFIPSDIKEFDELEKAVTKLIERNEKSYAVQKEFTENASHELQTPLAVMQSKLDLLLQENPNERQMQLVSELYDANLRMSKLSKNLLLLAKIDNAQFSQKTRLDLVEFYKNLLPQYHSLNPDKIITFNYEIQKFEIEANESLLTTLINNLVVNAIRHSPAEGNSVEIKISGAALTVSNAAVGGKLDESRLFGRFNSSPGENKSGNGLGLAIAKAVCDFHNWKLKYKFAENRHYFTVFF